MKTPIAAIALCGAMLALSVAHAGAAPRHQARSAPWPVADSGRDPDHVAGYYYPGWGRPAVPSYGVYPGLIYGGATSAPAGR